MANTFKIRSNRLAVHESLDGDWLTNVSMPLILCGSGTAQVNRAWGTMERLGEVGCLDRVQSTVLYDINNDTNRRITAKGRRMKSSLGTEIFMPQFIPTDTGFHRDPHGYMPYAGSLFQEQDNVVGEVGERSDQLGTPPQLIIHFMGFGSHCLLGAHLHNRLRDRFPQAHSLIILDVPRDPTLHDQMRDIWDELMELLPNEKFLVTDDRMGDQFLTDHKLACALATIEAVSQSGTQSGPTLTDVVSSLTKKGKSGTWLGMSSITAYRLPVKKSWNLMPPFRRTRLIRGKSDELALLGIRAAKDTMQARFDLAKYNDHSDDARSMIFCSVPLAYDEIPILESQVQNALINEGFFEEHPYASFGLASANMPSNATVKYVPNMPIRHNILAKAVIGVGRTVANITRFYAGAFIGRRVGPLFLHCTRLYPLTNITDPKTDIDSFKNIFQSKSPSLESNKKDAIETSVAAWQDAFESTMNSNDPAKVP